MRLLKTLVVNTCAYGKHTSVGTHVDFSVLFQLDAIFRQSSPTANFENLTFYMICNVIGDPLVSLEFYFMIFTLLSYVIWLLTFTLLCAEHH